jgi:hypothetical protein
VAAPCDLRLQNVTYHSLGTDLIVEADVVPVSTDVKRING